MGCNGHREHLIQEGVTATYLLDFVEAWTISPSVDRQTVIQIPPSTRLPEVELETTQCLFLPLSPYFLVDIHFQLSSFPGCLPNVNLSMFTCICCIFSIRLCCFISPLMISTQNIFLCNRS